MANVPRTVPFLLYFNKYDYLQWGDVLHNADDFVDFMSFEKLDGLIFNNMYKVSGLAVKSFYELTRSICRCKILFYSKIHSHLLIYHTRYNC